MVRPLAYLSIIAALLFLIAVVVLLFLAPGVDPMRFGISFYALAGYGPTLGIAIALAGVSGISLAAALWGATTRPPAASGWFYWSPGGSAAFSPASSLLTRLAPLQPSPAPFTTRQGSTSS